MREAAAATSPVGAAERIVALDTLRGVAVLGILVMNIYAFSMSAAAYSNPLAWGGTGWVHLGTWFFTHIFFDQKFMTIFSLLFGAGLVLMMSRAEARGADATGTWYRRTFWLCLIGAAHGYFVWFGDILFHYGLLGMLIYPFRHVSPRGLVTVACVLLALGIVTSFAGGTALKSLRTEAPAVIALEEAGEPLDEGQRETLEAWQRAAPFLKPPKEQVADDTAAYTGDYAEIVRYRAPLVAMMQSQGLLGFVLWRVGGLMLLGMALMKLGVLSGERSAAFYRRMMLLGYGMGLPIVILGAWNLALHEWDFVWMYRVGNLPNYVGSILVALGHVAAVMTILQRGLVPGLMTRFAAVGRMAFTNYLMHSLLLTTVFYGYGLALYGQVPRLQQMGIVAIVIALQLWLSPWWLARFRFGPAEWLWRSLTYWRRQPMRVAG